MLKLVCYLTLLGVFISTGKAARIPEGCEAPVIENGSVKTPLPASGVYAFGAKVRVKCDNGHDISHNFPVCEEGGTWTALPVCTKRLVVCTNPFTSATDPIPNPKQDTYNEGDTITISCRNGYVPSDPNALYTCEKNGRFQKDLAICIPKVCRVTNVPQHMILERYSYKLEEQVEYSCEWGFKATPVFVKPTCADGWKIFPNLPQCKRVTCARPQTGRGVKFYPDEDEYGIFEQLVFRCEDGYTMEKDFVSLKCMETGELSGTIPTCIKNGNGRTIDRCNLPESPENGRVLLKQDEHMVGDSIEFVCDEGYRRQGASKSYCEEDGNFHPRSPSCVAIYCVDPPDVKHGYVKISDTTLPYASFAEYFCDVGYKLSGKNILYCEEEGRFEPQAPKCIRASTRCNSPETPENGSKRPLWRTLPVGAEITYKCDAGFDLIGSETAECLITGEFSNNPPFCEDSGGTYCEHPGNIADGKANTKKTNFLVSEEITYECDAGFELIGEATLICGSSGKFSDAKPRCERCYEADEPNNGYVELRSGGKITYRCYDGYEIDGEAAGICIKGQYRPGPPRCVPISCGSASIENGVYKPPSSSVPSGTTITFECDIGYQLEGDEKIFCQTDGYFSNPPPKCLRICKIPKNLPDYVFIDSKKNSFVTGDKVPFSCSGGRRLLGPQTGRCLSNGKISPLPDGCKAKKRSCMFSCNFVSSASCQCDYLCSFYGNCCSDQSTFCQTFSFR